MSLNFEKTLLQAADISSCCHQSLLLKKQALSLALNVLQTCNSQELCEKIMRARTSWLIGAPLDQPSKIISGKPAPKEYIAAATDGSQIAPDRHSAFFYYLINIGLVILKYGKNSYARLDSQPFLRHQAQDMTIDNLHDNLNDITVDGEIVNLLRDVFEMEELSQMCISLDTSEPILAASDGSLIKWGFESKKLPPFFIESFLGNRYVHSLEKMRSGHIYPCGFISKSSARDVVNMIKVAICDKPQCNCEKYCSKTTPNERACTAIDSLIDRDIFEKLLEEDERSVCFLSSSKVNEYYGQNRIAFFYMKNQNEVCRVEVPQWLCVEQQNIDLTCAMLLDQSQKGQNYPVCLAEAHEQAVVSVGDKETLETLLQKLLLLDGLTSSTFMPSSKYYAKKTKRL